ncbi:MAG TPA: Zn-dependent hydrolase, partial [Anaerolineae bacterium]|nr:Zn-dependent hydrolase [Anaerolineae bacterium]
MPIASQWPALRIDTERFRAHFEALASIGATPDGGVNRPAFGEAHLAARHWFLETARQSGLETRVDGAGNHSALLRCGPPGAATLLLGSHLDSVPYGGRFDGALGVVAALEVLQVVLDQSLCLALHLEAIDFTDEEGSLANFVGSLGLTGRLEPAHLQNPRGGMKRFQQALARAGLSEGSLWTAARDPESLAGYLELHIEQGGRLADAGIEAGVVTAITGIRSFNVRFGGRADHAGTTPMESRRDAAVGASAFVLAVRETVMERFPGCVATVGNMAFEPGVFNVVAHRVTTSLEFRAEDEARLDAIEAALREAAVAAARPFGLDVDIETLDRTAPAQMHPRVQAALAEACAGLGLSHRFLPSGAGHDAQCLAQVCPTGMIFVPSAGGLSHSA